jgi:hypothetical protein
MKKVRSKSQKDLLEIEKVGIPMAEKTGRVWVEVVKARKEGGDLRESA